MKRSLDKCFKNVITKIKSKDLKNFNGTTDSIDISLSKLQRAAESDMT